mmetsp:Transcript_21289/g.30441  ORF Transcript_21289/g.30441 Transcript_21289/m.30441 type:complete len:105 (+) Transcript_21289:134-448(+)
MHAMNRLWLMYLNFVQTRQHENLSDSNIITTIRRLYDRAFINLRVTQHDKIWPEYLAWAKSSILFHHKKQQQMQQHQESKYLSKQLYEFCDDMLFITTLPQKRI